MILKESVDTKCKECGKYETTIPALKGCDVCKSPIYEECQSSLDIKVFRREDKDGFWDQYIFCSWKCLFKKLKTLKTYEFISLPYLAYEKQTKGTSVKDFWKVIKSIK